MKAMLMLQTSYLDFSLKLNQKDYLNKVLRVIKKWVACKHIGIRVIDTVGNIPYESYIGFEKNSGS